MKDNNGFGNPAAKEPFFKKLKGLMSNKTFLSLCCCLSGLYLIVTGIQFWVPNYLQVVIKVPEHKVNIFFAVTCFSAPVGGVVVGGVITSCFGGYNTKKSFRCLRIVGFLAVCVALPIPFLKTFAIVGSLFWLLLFLGGFLLPSLTGIMISSVDDNQKAQANSVANICYNLLGYLPAPVLYGFIATYCKPDSTIPMGVLLYTSLLTVGLLQYGLGKRMKVLEEKDADNAGDGTKKEEVKDDNG